MPSPWVAGADGCRDGWIVALRHTETGEHRTRFVSALADALRAGPLGLSAPPAVLAVDVPIGLPGRAPRGGRPADRAARALLGSPRSSSVFSPPARPALYAETHEEAVALNRASGPDAPGLSIQAFGIFPKLREADALATASLQRGDGPVRMVEAHPEVAFAQMNGGEAVAEKKKRSAGRAIRAELLRQSGVADPLVHVQNCRGMAPADDVLDALACAWTADRVLRGTALRLPEDPETDPRGLFMEIWA